MNSLTRFFTARNALSFFALCCLAFGCGGCAVAPLARSIAERAQTLQEVRRQTSTSVDESYAQSLLENSAQTSAQNSSSSTAAPKSGPGLIVCEPVSRGASQEIVEFATGCARWLHLHASGHGELGQSPVWGVIADSRDALKRGDLRFSKEDPKEDATEFADVAGVTHLALGTISGTSARAKLSYQLFRVEGKLQPVGARIEMQGTREQIIQALPQAARTLAKSLGVASPRVPAIQIAPEDFALLGFVPWKAKKPVEEETATMLAELATREPLAGVLYLRSGAPRESPAQLQATLSSLMKNSAQNTVIVADVARFFAADIRAQEKVVFNLRARFPHNYLAATSEMEMQKEKGDWIAAQSAAEDAVRAAPRSACAWLDLGQLLGDYAGSIRNGKYSAKMTTSERSAVYKLYPQALSAAWRATQLAPNYSFAWSDVAEAATFNGNNGVADTALWKAHALDTSNSDVYSWGLQMYQPKWGGDKTKLLKIARLAVQYADPDDFPARNLADAIHHGGLIEYREELLTAAVKRSPKSVIANYEYGAILHYNKRDYASAEKYYRIALAGDPQYARALASLADLTFFVKNDSVEAERLYRQAVASDPSDSALADKLQRFLESKGGAAAR